MADHSHSGELSADATKKKRKMALGRGLDALIPDLNVAEVTSGGGAASKKDYFLCQIHMIRPNPHQPRHQFPEEELAELAESIRQQGIIQPLLVRQNGPGYELVAGERRLRAAARVGLDQVPVVVRDISDARMLEISIVENIQRENFNPMEEADAYHRLLTEFHLTQEEVAARVGKSRSAVANFLRLRQLPDFIKADILAGSLSMGHARALLGASTLAQQKQAWREVIAKKLSVRETESLVRRLNIQAERPAAISEPSSEDRYFNDVSENLSRYFGTRVYIRRKGKRGRLEIDFFSDEDLDRLLTMLKPR